MSLPALTTAFTRNCTSEDSSPGRLLAAMRRALILETVTSVSFKPASGAHRCRLLEVVAGLVKFERVGHCGIKAVLGSRPSEFVNTSSASASVSTKAALAAGAVRAQARRRFAAQGQVEVVSSCKR